MYMHIMPICIAFAACWTRNDDNNESGNYLRATRDDSRVKQIAIFFIHLKGRARVIKRGHDVFRLSETERAPSALPRLENARARNLCNKESCLAARRLNEYTL